MTTPRSDICALDVHCPHKYRLNGDIDVSAQRSEPGPLQKRRAGIERELSGNRGGSGASNGECVHGGLRAMWRLHMMWIETGLIHDYTKSVSP